ncbi:MAG TPA: hypothetical protein VG938_19650 [Verrucomicrobiae bacterium]|jgi:hypothetical protein|nr:hypothetical protein [Verrucomicrobiae bacterium]
MATRKIIAFAFRTPLVALCFARAAALNAADTNIETQLRALQQQNEALQSQLHQQQELIDSLRRDVTGIRQSNEQRDAELKDDKAAAAAPGETARTSGFNLGKVHLSGEGGVGLFESGSEGASPNSEFRVDEAKLFVDAQVWGDVYAFAELNLATREEPDVELHLGELYLDVEDISKLWGRTGQLNARIGRLDIPFGEEYLTRDVIDDPLISRSLSDIWGVDEGLELYGSLGKFNYVAAVQNGGISDTRDFNGDKSVTGRLSYDATPHLHFSVSGMRTGDLSAQQDTLSALWFSDGFIRPLGAGSVFHANLVEGDVAWRLPHGHVSAFGGYIRYNDNDPAANNGRDVYYYSVEGVHDIAGKLYGAARFSQIFAPHGFPIVGNADMNAYLFGPLADRMWRLSLGLGYRWNEHFILKTEYTLERGKGIGGENRDHEDLFATEAVFGF